MLLLAVAVLACAVAGVLRALAAQGVSIRDPKPLHGWPLRLYTASLFLATIGLVLVFVAFVPLLRALPAWD